MSKTIVRDRTRSLSVGSARYHHGFQKLISKTVVANCNTFLSQNVGIIIIICTTLLSKWHYFKLSTVVPPTHSYKPLLLQLLMRSGYEVSFRVICWWHRCECTTKLFTISPRLLRELSIDSTSNLSNKPFCVDVASHQNCLPVILGHFK